MSGTHGLLQPSRPGYFYITLEESYVTLFKIGAEKWFSEHKSEEDAVQKKNARLAHAVAKAYITDVLVHLSNDLYKQTQSQQNLWVFLSFPQLESRLHGGVKMRTLKDAMKEMIEDGYVFKRPNRDPRYKSLEYRLNLPKYRKELDALPSKPDKDESANLHDEIDSANPHNDSANLHCDSANPHDDNANLHDDNANLHAIHNIDSIKTKYKQDSSEPVQATPKTVRKQKSLPLSLIYEDYDFCIVNLNIVPTDYHTPHIPENDRAMQTLTDQGATRETLLRVIKSLRDDPDDFYRKSINPVFVAKHYAARVSFGVESRFSQPQNKPLSLAERNRMNREKYGIGN